MSARRRVVVVGADAAGMSAASQALRVAARRGERLEVVAFDSGGHTSYSACGIPYWVAGDVADRGDLVARTAEEHRANGIDLRLHEEVVGLDLDRGEVVVAARAPGRTGTTRVGFDEVVLASGAEPVLPEWAQGVRHVLPVKTLDDGARWLEVLERDRPASALVVGGGFIGVEMAETLVRRGLTTTLVTRGAEPMSTLEPAMGALVRQGLERLGVEVVVDAEVEGLECDDAGRVEAACVGGRRLEADVVALGLGVRPRTRVWAAAGLAVGEHGGLLPDDRQSVRPGVWAAGDCCEVVDRLLPGRWLVPLGTHATKQGRVLGTNLGGGDARFGGVVGTAITRVGDLEVARTGILHRWARSVGLDAVAVTKESSTAAGYMPEAAPVTVHVLAERGSGRLLGAQLVGGRGAGKRVDVAATALWAGLGVQDLADADLAYAPPFSPVWDPLQIACRAAAELV